MSETEQKKKSTKALDQKPKEGAEEGSSPPSSLPIEEKIKPPETRVEIITKPEEKTETDVTVYKWTECPYCGNPNICHDPKNNVYYCERCKTPWH